MIITIKKIEVKAGANGRFWRVESDQGWFSVFDQNLGPVLTPGQWDVEIETKGNFKHINTAKLVNGQAPSAAGGPAGAPPKAEKPSPETAVVMPESSDHERNIMIARQVALKAAVELAGYHIAKTGKEFNAAEILKVAAAFNEWLIKGKP